MRVHVIQTGRIQWRAGFTYATRLRGALRAALRGWGEEIPILAYVVEHPEGHLVLDTGASAYWGTAAMPIAFRRIARMHISPDDEIGPQMRRVGLRPEDVRLVIPTHLDIDHAGGVGQFPNADVIVHRPEYEFSKTVLGKARYQPAMWPETFKPKLYDLEPERFGPFTESLSITPSGDVKLVPIPGHSIAQVAPVVRADGVHLFFGGDHMIRARWFAEDIPLDRTRPGSLLHPRKGKETNRRIAAFLKEYPTILLPSHDIDAADNISRWRPLQV